MGAKGGGGVGNQAPVDDFSIDAWIVPSVEQSIQGNRGHGDAGTDGDQQVDQVLRVGLIRQQSHIDQSIQDVQWHPADREGNADRQQGPRDGLIPLHVPLVRVCCRGSSDCGGASALRLGPRDGGRHLLLPSCCRRRWCCS